MASTVGRPKRGKSVTLKRRGDDIVGYLPDGTRVPISCLIYDLVDDRTRIVQAETVDGTRHAVKPYW